MSPFEAIEEETTNNSNCKKKNERNKMVCGHDGLMFIYIYIVHNNSFWTWTLIMNFCFESNIDKKII